MSELSAYEKMFKDGTAYKPIKIQQPTPDNPTGSFGGSSGEEIDPNKINEQLFDNHMDDYIQSKIEAKKSKTNETKKRSSTRPSVPSTSQPKSNRIAALERRVELLEQALGLVMETQTKMMKG